MQTKQAAREEMQPVRRKAVNTTDMRMHMDAIEHELRNWARWCWQGPYPHPLPPQQCASLEGGYSRYGEDTPTEAEDYRPIKPNEDHAKIVNAAWELLPEDPKRVLRAEYPQRHESGRAEHGMAGAARRLRMSLAQYESALSLAVYRISLAFKGKI